MRHSRAQVEPVGRSADLIERFLEMMAVERAAAESTLRNYRRTLDRVHGFVRSRGETLSTVGADDLSAFLAVLEREGSSNATAALHMSALRQFFLFLYTDGLREDNPAALLERPKTPRSLPKALTREDVDTLFARASIEGDAKGLRLSAILEILYAGGLRVSELATLPRGALNLEHRTMIVRGKGDRERIAPLTEKAVAAIKRYLPLRKEFGPETSPYLFVSRGKAGHLTQSRIAQLLKELAGKAGLDARKVSPHVLRHSFATHLLAGGANLKSVQKMLGHADITTTEIYTHVAIDHLQELVLKKHPLADKK
ncbi:MAG: site-specific tyrosine recombinase/integron integrase [Pseudomonadota bacterium]